MRLPNGYGSVYKLSGKRRKPYIARKTRGYDDNGKQLYSIIGYYATRQQALQALADYNFNPYDLELGKITFAEIYENGMRMNLMKIQINLHGETMKLHTSIVKHFII